MAGHGACQNTNFGPSPAEVANKKLSEAAKIIQGFQASCNDAAKQLYNLAQQGKPKGKDDKEAAHTNVVKPYLESLRGVLRFATSQFIDVRVKRLETVMSVLRNNKELLAQCQCHLEGLQPQMDKDTENIDDYMAFWEDWESYIGVLYAQVCNPRCPRPNLQLIEHPSAEVCQKSYADLMRKGRELCGEIMCNLEDNQCMYDHLVKTEIKKIKCDLQQAFSTLSAAEERAKALACKARNSLRAFREQEHAVAIFLEEWEKGGEKLNQPSPDIPPSPKIIELGEAELEGKPSSRGRDKNLELMIKRFTKLNNSVKVEVQNEVEQQEILNESARAMNSVGQGSTTGGGTGPGVEADTMSNASEPPPPPPPSPSQPEETPPDE